MIYENEDIADIYEGYTLIQKKDGFRFGTDAVLLSDFFNGKKSGKTLEIGCGNGIIPILLIAKNKLDKIKSLEIQKEVAQLAKRNIQRNGLESKIELLNIDVKELKEGNLYDYIISNPPYMAVDGKIINDSETKRIARHEVNLNLEEFVKNSKRLLKPRGELFFIHRSHRFLEISEVLSRNGFSIKRVKFVHYNSEKDASLVLIEASKGRRNMLKIEPPIFIEK